MRKAFPLLLAMMASIAMTGYAAAQEAPPPDGPRPDAKPQRHCADKIFDRLDANNDGNITSAEIPPAMPERLRQLLDEAVKKSDGNLSKDELIEMIKQRHEGRKQKDGPPKFDAKKIFTRLDTDKDGSLSLDEFTKGAEQFHRKMMRHMRPPMMQQGPMGHHGQGKACHGPQGYGGMHGFHGHPGYGGRPDFYGYRCPCQGPEFYGHHGHGHWQQFHGHQGYGGMPAFHGYQGPGAQPQFHGQRWHGEKPQFDGHKGPWQGPCQGKAFDGKKCPGKDKALKGHKGHGKGHSFDRPDRPKDKRPEGFRHGGSKDIEARMAKLERQQARILAMLEKLLPENKPMDHGPQGK